MLMGIVAKNSILLVDFAIEEMRAGKDRFTALLEAGPQARAPHRDDHGRHDCGHAADRARASTGTPRFRAPMAVAVIGGLLTSTALTLVVVPAVFTLIDDIEALARAESGQGHCSARSRALRRPPARRLLKPQPIEV